MIWQHTYVSSPQIDTVLEKEGVTLQELLNEECIIQELKAQNKKLIEFLTRPDVLEELVTLITTEPSEDIDERERYRHPNIACELLTTDIPHLSQKLIVEEEILTKLYSFLESDPPLNPLLASFFSRTMGILVTRRQEQNWYSYQFSCLQVLDFLKSKETCIPLLMKHLGTSAVMDLTLKLVTQIDDMEMRQNILSWLDSQELVQSVVQLLDPSVDADRHCSASQLLCDIIVKSREAELSYDKPEANPILNTIESPKTVTKLLDLILSGEKCESSIVGGISVLMTLLEPVKPSGSIMDHDQGRYGMMGSGDIVDSLGTPPVTLSTIEAIFPYLPALHDLLINPPKKPAVKMTSGLVDPPLGNTRLHVIKLLSALIATHNFDINSKLNELGTVGVLLDLFFTYTWNNFLHTQVEKCLAFALNSDPAISENSHQNILLNDIFVKCQLIQKILDAWSDNDKEQEKPGGCRRGYMGHLIKIANHINYQAEKGPLRDFLREAVSEESIESWDAFSTSTLQSINKIQSMCLGGEHPGTAGSQSDKDCSDIPLAQDATIQQTYEEYQTQQMAHQFTENFGYREGDFNDTEDSLHPSVDQLTNLPFNMAEEDELERRAEMFNQVCAHKVDTLDEKDDVDDDEEDEAQWSVYRNINSNSRIWTGREEAANYNSSDDEERPGPEGREEASGMEVDQADPWGNTTTTQQDPWAGTPINSSGDEEGWANFDANFAAAASTSDFFGDNNADRSEPTGSVSSPTNQLARTTLSEPTDAGAATISNTDTATTTTATTNASSVVVLPSELTSAVEISDSNANVSRNVDEVSSSVPVQDENKLLMDNYRFLSGQGLMTAANGEITLPEQQKSVNEVMNVGSTISSDDQATEQKCAQPELEKVVVAVAATASPAGSVEGMEPSQSQASSGAPTPTAASPMTALNSA